MEIDAKSFWIKVDALLSESKKNLRVLCDETGIIYGTVSMQRLRGSLPKLEQIADMAIYFSVSLDELVFGDSSNQRLPAAVKAVMQNSRLQTIVSALLASPDKLSAIETLLGVKQVPPDVKSLA